jgi:hypothetical protein
VQGAFRRSPASPLRFECSNCEQINALCSFQNGQSTPRGGFLGITPVLRTLSKRKSPEDTIWLSWGHICPQALPKTLQKRLREYCVLRTAPQVCPWDILLSKVSQGQLTQRPEDTFVVKCLQDAHFPSPAWDLHAGFKRGVAGTMMCLRCRHIAAKPTATTWFELAKQTHTPATPQAPLHTPQCPIHHNPTPNTPKKQK